MKVRKALLVALIISALSGAALAGGLTIYQNWLIARLEATAAELTASYIPLRFMVLSRGDATIAARFRFYAPDGREVAVFERTWSGYELAIDSWVARFGDRPLVFPARVFTEAIAPGRGTELFGYYDRDGFPAIFDQAGLTKDDRTALSELFGRLRDLELDGSIIKGLPGLYGNAVHEIQRLRSFEVGVVYDLVVRSTGGLEIIRE